MSIHFSQSGDVRVLWLLVYVNNVVMALVWPSARSASATLMIPDLSFLNMLHVQGDLNWRSFLLMSMVLHSSEFWSGCRPQTIITAKVGIK
jgi:hypothetical protein